MTGSAEKRFVNVSSIVATIDEVEGELFLFSSGTFVNGQTVHLVTGRLIYTKKKLPRIEASTAQ